MVSVSVTVAPKPFYGPGDVVKGFVSVTTSKPKTDCAVKASILGLAASSMTEHCLHKCGNSDTTHTRRQPFYTSSVVLASGINIPAGTTQYPFEFQMPMQDDIPSTIEREDMGIFLFQQAEVSLTYSVEGSYVGDSGFFDNTSGIANFTFYGTIQDSKPVSNSTNGPVSQFELSSKGFVGLDLDLPCDHVIMGKELKFSLATDNSNCKLDITGLRASIKKQMTGKTKYDITTKNWTVGETNFAFPIPSGKSLTFDGAVAIPHMHHASTATEAVDCDYFLELAPVYKGSFVQAPSVMVKINIEKARI